MEIFKTAILKQEFERFQKEDLIEILKCGYCQKTVCESFHTRFLVSCKFCRKNFCKIVIHLISQKKIFYQILIKMVKST